MRLPEVKVTAAMVRAQRERKFFVSSEGSVLEQELVECGGGIKVLDFGVARIMQPDETLTATYILVSSDALNTCSGASVRPSIGSWWVGALGTSNDVDWFRFKTTTAGAFRAGHLMSAWCWNVPRRRAASRR